MNNYDSTHNKIKDDCLKLLEFEGNQLVFDANNMYLFKIDSITAVVLKQEYSFSELENTYGRDVVLSAIDKANRLRLVSEQAGLEQIQKRQLSFSSLWLNVSHKCNMSCKYCFADHGSYGQQESFMDESIMQNAVRLLLEKCSGSHARIVFFGGEPMLNYELIKQTVIFAKAEAKEKKITFKFTIITNGTIVSNDIIAFIKEHMIKVQVSIDAQPEINDTLRIFRNGKGSSDIVHENLSSLRNAGIKNISIRGTLTHFNPNVSELLDYFKDLGYEDAAFIPVQANNENSCHLTQEDIEIIKQQYRKKAYEIITSFRQGNETGLSLFARYFNIIVKGKKREYYCGAGFNFFSVTPDGEIYPCHRIIGKENFRMGIVPNFQFHDNDFMKTVGFSVNEKKLCQDCWAKHFCGGGCAANTFYNNSDTEQNNMICELTKELAENALKIYYAVYSSI